MAAYTGVHLAFKHALSSIVFSVRTKEDYKTANGATITLTGLSISNIGKTSTFNQGITDGNLATSAAEWDEPSTKNTTYVAYDGLKEITTTRYWTYEGTAAITRDIDGTSPEQDRIFTFTNTPKSSTPLNDEAIVVNTMTL